MQTQLHRSGLLRFNEMTLSLRFTSEETDSLLQLLEERASISEDDLYVYGPDIPHVLRPLFEEVSDVNFEGMHRLSPLFDHKLLIHHLNTIDRNYQEEDKPVMFYEQADSLEEFQRIHEQLNTHMYNNIPKAVAEIIFAHPFEDLLTLRFMPGHRLKGEPENLTLEGPFVKFIGAHKVEKLIDFQLHDSMIKVTYFSNIHYEIQTYVYHV